MSTPKRSRVPNRRFLSHIGQLPKRFMAWLLRLVFISARFGRTRQAGFVLPTTVLLLLILTLTVFGLSFRSFTRSAQVIASREQQTIDNIAAPAIDRAKAKLEYLFLRDARFPGGVPSSDVLQSMMLNDGLNGIPKVTATDPYTFPDETRLNDIDGDTSTEDNAWVFDADVDGRTQNIAYSILMDDENGVVLLTDDLTSAKADAKVTRNGPISSNESAAGCGAARSPEGGWQIVDSSTVQKNFQITAFAANGSDVNRTTTALEFQQVRQADRGNKWGAWFKYDLELFPGASDAFFWNGAMHTEGNFITRGDLTAQLISSPNSCLYTKDASEITLAEHKNAAGDPNDDFRGYAIFGTTGNNRFGTGGGVEGTKPKFDLFDGPLFNEAFVRAEDAVDGGANEDTAEVIDRITIDPVALFTQDSFFHRNKTGWAADGAWEARPIESRLENENTRVPFLDDTFRADNRYGPKPDYDPGSDLDDLGANPIGATIASNPTLIDSEGGLDGFWERQAIDRGLRLLVGQRLELGNTFGWGGSDPVLGDPLYPVAAYDTSEKMQRRSLRDNLAAVQGMVVYHHESGGDFPLACIASTAHPGTQQTIVDSRRFENQILATPADTVRVDFLEGRGTNGWEFGYNPDFDTGAKFTTQYNSATSPLKKALINLAYFAGDPDGGAPSFTPVQDSFVHPFPWMAMWGDFSPLRRIINGGTAYASLSPADQSTLHSAACTLGLLAYNLESLEAEFNDIQVSGNWAAPSANQQTAARQFLQSLADRTYGFNTAPTSFCVATLTALGVSPLPSAAVQANICPTQVKYPALYYLFPVASHDQNTGQPAAEEYIDATTSVAPSTLTTYQRSGTDVNDGLTYQVIDSTTPAAVPNNLSGIANTVRLPAAWKLPSTAAAVLTDPDDTATDQSMRINYPADLTQPSSSDSAGIEVSLLDKGMYDGRELLGSHILDVDVSKLTSNTNPDGVDHWIADLDGIVYAFREDAVREDEIVRPKESATVWANCDEWAESNSDVNCRLRVIGTPDPARRIFLQDPPLPPNGISVKPVDFYPDPERRPDGFRLINGKTLNRASNVLAGMTFVSDNTIYIKGDFNLHTTNAALDPNTAAGCAALLEEFTEKLDPDCDPTTAAPAANQFYARATLNTATFAEPANDVWRPSEVVGDAVGILSADFLDGNIADGFTLARASTGPLGQGTSSYQNQNRPKTPTANWRLEDSTDGPPAAAIPIAINRNGGALESGGAEFAEADYLSFGDSNFTTRRSYDQQTPIPTRTNAVFISGIIPSRAGQTYGGMHNFPRFLEYWDTVNLYIAGGFFQLNFSTAATGPFDQEAWEPGSPANEAGFVSPFYGAPNRNWGYDVGLQYAPAAPVSRRFVTVGRTRSEFYRELPVDDPYVANLRCATYNGAQVDPAANCP